nr:uncharacterized protein LOC118877101 [Drosophila suzukii]XP_036669973.1 uncharacterized protein LOC118877102 [Drosophila suzukii]
MENITNEYCKKLLTQICETSHVDTKDYLYTILLNAVLPTTCRFSDHMGKKIRKETISDCQESMVLKLTNLNNYQTKINTMISKYYNAGMKLQPLLIVEGLEDSDIKSFYVYFEKRLVKFSSFLESFTMCFKLFQVEKFFFNLDII